MGLVIFMFMMNMLTELIYFALIFEEVRKETKKKPTKTGKMYRVVLEKGWGTENLRVDRVKSNDSQTPTGQLALFGEEKDEYVLYVHAKCVQGAVEEFFRQYGGRICH